jgi:nucleotide sugar dehydrogenase
LLAGRAKLLVWGLGYIGYSTMCHFAAKGVICIGVDPDQERVADANGVGSGPLPNFREWLGFDPDPDKTARLMSATTVWAETNDLTVAVHMVAVPTEQDGRPTAEAIVDVTNSILARCQTAATPPLIIFESTVPVHYMTELVEPLAAAHGVVWGKDVYLAVAPRRDWFLTPDKTLATLPRIVGGADQRATLTARDVLSIVCQDIRLAPDHLHACAVKSVENALRHLGITFANELSVGYPDLDTREILRLAGTKWNVETYWPALGIGGYCVPLAPQYLLSDMKTPTALGLLRESVKAEARRPDDIAAELVRRKIESVSVLGIGYAPDLAIISQSPGLRLAKSLQERGVEVAIHDPVYSSVELRAITGLSVLTDAARVHDRQAIVFATAHSAYYALGISGELARFSGLVLDGTNSDHRVLFAAADPYLIIGHRGWWTG